MSALNSYPQYKDSGAKWLGAVPDAWGIQPLWTLFRRSKRLGTGEEELLSVYRDYGVIPKSSRDDNHNRASEDLSKYQLVNVGDLVINKMKAWQGSVAVSEFEGIVSPAYFVFRSLSNHDLRFFHYLFRSRPYIGAYASISKGVRPSQWDLDPDKHRVLPVLLPPFSEQRAIASYLDHETAEIDAFIADQEELIALLHERRAATITQAVTKGLDLSVLMKDSGIEWIGKVPEPWGLQRLSWLFNTISSGTTPPSDNQKYYGGDINWVTTGELRESVITETAKKLTDEAINELSALRVYEPGTLLIAMYGATIGRLGVLGAPATTNQACCAMAEPKHVSSNFISYVLIAAREHLLVLASGGGQPNINQDKLRALRVPTPPLQEQQKIVEYLDYETSEIDAAIVDAKEAIELSKERRAALISAAVTGKIDVRDHTTADPGVA